MKMISFLFWAQRPHALEREVVMFLFTAAGTTPAGYATRLHW